jgi:predicted heme/steroid binding protein
LYKLGIYNARGELIKGYEGEIEDISEAIGYGEEVHFKIFEQGEEIQQALEIKPIPKPIKRKGRELRRKIKFGTNETGEKIKRDKGENA